MRIFRRLVLATTSTAVVAALALVSVPDATAATQKVTTSYSCSSQAGSGTSSVKVRTSLPTRVKKGNRIAASRTTVSLQVPQALLDQLRTYGVKKVSLTTKAGAVRLRVGGQKVAVKKFAVPPTRVPASGPMTLTGVGTLAAFAVKKPGVYTVKVPRAFLATAHASASYGSLDAPLDCSLAPRAPAALGTLKVTR